MEEGRKVSDEIQFPNEFVAILDKDGDVVDFCSPNDDVIQSLRRLLDGENPSDVPHTAWVWNRGWRRWD